MLLTKIFVNWGMRLKAFRRKTRSGFEWFHVNLWLALRASYDKSVEILQSCKSPWSLAEEQGLHSLDGRSGLCLQPFACCREESSAAGTWAATTVCSVSYQDKLRLLVYAEESQQLIHYQPNHSSNRKGDLKEYGRQLDTNCPFLQWGKDKTGDNSIWERNCKTQNGKRETWEGEKGKRDIKVRKDTAYHPGLQSAMTSSSSVCVFRGE